MKSYLKQYREASQRPGACIVSRPNRRGRLVEVACLLAPNKRSGRRARI